MTITPINQRKCTNLFLGDGKTTVASAGCYSCCLAMISGKSIEDTLTALKSGGAFNGALLKHPQDALAVGFDSYESTTTDPKSLCIAEVDFNPDPDKDQHFVVWLGDGNIIDPWGGVKKKNPYKVYTYRIYKPLNEPMNKDFVEQVALLCGKKKDFYGENLNEKEQKDAAERLKQFREDMDGDAMIDAEKIKELEKERDSALESLRVQKTQVAVLKENLRQCTASTQTPEVPSSIDNYSLAQLAGAFFRKLIKF